MCRKRWRRRRNHVKFLLNRMQRYARTKALNGCYGVMHIKEAATNYKAFEVPIVSVKSLIMSIYDGIMTR